ncbi:ketopantoate reductase family protein [bacterium]|nr:MAG: ketopantoate reductase family protein [bacterium]
MKNGRYLILGAGAIGSVFGGMLARGGQEVALVGRRDHMDAIAEDGLKISGILGNHVVSGITTTTSVGELSREPVPDAVMVCVKSCDTQEVIGLLAGSSLVSERTGIVSLQNGLGNIEKIKDAFGGEKSFGGRVIFGAEIVKPGSVNVTVWADKVLLGGGDPETASYLARVLTRCGIETEAVDDILSALWEKVLYNVGLNPLSAILEVPYGELGRDIHAKSLLVGLIKEAFSVAQAENSVATGSPDEYLELFFGRLLPATVSHRSSMWQDIRQGRKTEIDAINGEVVRRGKIHGINVPLNEIMVDLVKAKVALFRHQRTEVRDQGSG